MAEETDWGALQRLFDVIENRKDGDPGTSYSAKLLAGGPPKIGKKISEEAAEITIASLSEGKEAVARESADLLYHLLVMWAAMDVRPEDVLSELKRREGVSGIDEKNSRKS